MLKTVNAASWQSRPLAMPFQSLEPATCSQSCPAAAEGAVLTLAAFKVCSVAEYRWLATPGH